MLFRILLVYITVLLFSSSCLADGGELSPSEQSHVEVSLRMVGHQVLLSAGDSTSIVLPVEKEGGRYRIRFGAAFGFDPERASNKIDSVIRATNIASNYIVEFVSCDSQKVVHSYEIGEENDVLACKGRAQPEACYELWITLIDKGTDDSAALFLSGPTEPNQESNTSMLWMMSLVAGATAIAVYLLMRNSKSKVDPNEIRIGAFVFNKKKMELSIDNNRIELTGKESDLLQLLSESANDTVEREQILNAVWGDEGDYVGRTLDVFISKLRKKLEADANVRIVNIRGIGYKLVLSEG